MPPGDLTEQQKKWMASVKASLETSTGKSMDEWTAIAKTCPETAPKARQRWFKETHGLGQNYAQIVMMAAAEGSGERDPAEMRAALWADAGAAAILAAIEAAVSDFPGLVSGQRKTYNTWSRKFAFAAARPVRGGLVRLGLALDPGGDARLIPAAKEGWPERLKSTLVVSGPEQVDAALLRAAWENG